MTEAAAFLAVLTLIFSQAAWACAPASRDISVPAVVGSSDGGLLGIHVETRPGNGTSYFSVMPNVGTETQNSLRTAAGVAFARAVQDPKKCDVLVSITDYGNSKFIDGPSAGAAMTVAIEAALLNRTLRDDVIMTGTIENDGSIGPVGGTIEKALAISERTGTMMLTPAQDVHERMILMNLRKTRAIGIYEVGNIADVEKIVFEPKGTPVEETEFEIQFTPVPANMSSVELDSDLLRFRGITDSVIGEYSGEVAGIAGTDYPTMKFREYFEKELAKQKELNGKGYVFAAANNAFLLTIDARFLKKGFSSDLDLEAEKSSISQCLSGLPASRMTDENFQWVAGADMRREWSGKKLNETEIRGLELKEDEYEAFRSLQFARSWCGVSSNLTAAGGSGGNAIDEAVFREIAKSEMGKAQEAIDLAGIATSDEEWHLGAAQENFAAGKYAAAAYDSAYAYATVAAREKYAESGAAGVAAEYANITSKKMSSLWAKIYQGQAEYISGSDGKISEAAYRIAAYAQELEYVTSRMNAAIGAESGAPAQDGEASAQEAGAGGIPSGGMEFFCMGAFGAAATMAGLMLAMTLIERKAR
jgi:predicted S18 family serine protease